MKRYMEYRFGQAYTPRKKHRLRNTVGIIVLIILISAISIGIQFAIQYSIVEDIPTWTSSLPSYWGGIVGGAISGTISIVGVYLTIKYYRDSDASKSRIEHMPFIYIKLIDAHKVEAVDLSKAKVIEVPNRKYEIDKGNKMLIDLELENIGNGFANTLVLHLGNNLGGEQYSKLIKVNETVHLQLKFYVVYGKLEIQ